MSRGDKYSRANALSRMLSELAGHLGSKESAKQKMDQDLGPEWQKFIIDIQENDQGSLFVEPELLDYDGDPSLSQLDDSVVKSVDMAKSMGFPVDDLECDLFEFNIPETEPEPKSETKPDARLASFLRMLADALDK